MNARITLPKSLKSQKFEKSIRYKKSDFYKIKLRLTPRKDCNAVTTNEKKTVLLRIRQNVRLCKMNCIDQITEHLLLKRRYYFIKIFCVFSFE